MGLRVLLLTNELATVSAVTTALKSTATLDSANVCRDPGELALLLEDGSIAAALIDIDGEPKRMLAAIEPLTRRFSQTRFVVLSGQMQNDLLLEAMQVGARHFMVKESIAGDLSNVLQRLCPPHEHGTQGVAVTILSAGGGCGATTVAVNLAVELSAAAAAGESEPPLVVDLDHNYGAVATYLGVDGEYGVVDLMNRGGALDAQLIQSTAISSRGRPSVLINTARGRMGEAVSMNQGRMRQLVEACKSAYKWTVIDAPRVPMTIATELALYSDVTLLLLQLTIKDIRIARQTLASLVERGVPATSVKLLVNRYRKRGQLISLEEAREALGLTPAATLTCLSNDYHTVTEAVNLGKTLAQAAPRSDFRRDLQGLATSIAQVRPVSSRQRA
jgi:pilus assembly protein CpaE